MTVAGFQSLQEELSYYAFSFSILERLKAELAAGAVFKGRTVGWHCHLTALTAASAEVLLEAGCRLYLSECSAATTDPEAVAFMQELGASVFLGGDSPGAVLAVNPEVISDTGFVMTGMYLHDLSCGGPAFLKGSCEITTSGIHKLRRLAGLPFPVININDCCLKRVIENTHGVGDGVIAALSRLSGRMLCGRAVGVVGYGPVGAGVAFRLKQSGAQVLVVEDNPVRRLLAHYDGFALAKLPAALALCELIITATGSKFVIGEKELASCRDGIMLMNVGHFADEIDLGALRRISAESRLLSAFLEEFDMPDGKKLYLAAAGAPANVAMLSGSPEPTLIHLSLEILALRYLLESASALRNGENAVPGEVEKKTALIALESLGLD